MMRFLELDLRAYGPFTGRTLDLSGGEHGLHVIYGANEAGKSSALRAVKALLYGFPKKPRHPDNFLHEYGKLRVGARLRHSDGSTLAVLRRRGNKNTLLDYDDADTLDDGVLARFLGGVDEERFALLFGIGHQDLVAGGRQILEGGGGVGESLFAAALGGGGASLRQVREKLDSEAEALFLRRGKNPHINRALSELEDARRQIRDASLSSDEWTRHRRALDQASEERAGLIATLRARRVEKNRLERLRRAQAGLARRRELEAQRAAMGEVVRLPEGFGEERRDTERALDDARAARDRDRAELLRIAARIDELAVPEAVLAHGDSIDALFQRLGTVRAAAEERLASQGSRQQLEADARALLAELRPDVAIEDVEVLRLPASFKAEFQDLAGRHQAVEDAVRKAHRDVDACAARVGELEAEEAALPAPRDASALRRAVEQARKQGDMDARLDEARRALRAAESQADVELRRLGLWQGTLEALEALPVPSEETIERFAHDWSEHDHGRSHLDEQMRKAQAALAEIERDIEALQRAGAVPSEDDLARCRAQRDEAWQRIRGRLLGEEEEEAPGPAPAAEWAEGFEEQVREADMLADRLRREADRIATQASLLAHRGDRAHALAELEAEQRRLDQVRERLARDWAGCWAAAGIEPLQPKEMRTWRKRHQDLAQAAAGIRERRVDLETLAERARSLGEMLRAGLLAVDAAVDASVDASAPGGAAPDVGALLSRAVQVIEAIEATEAQRRTLGTQREREQAQLGLAQKEHEQALAERTRWQVAWQDTMARLGLPPDASPPVANAVLARFDELFRKLDGAADLGRRIQALDADRQQLEADVAALVARVDPEAAALPCEQAVEELYARLQKARKDDALRAQLDEQRADRERSSIAADEQIARMRRRLDELCRQAGSADAAALPEVEARSARARELERALAGIEQQLVEQGEGWTLDELEHEAAQVDADALPARIAELDVEIHQLDERRSQVQETIGREKTELAHMDGVSRAAEAAELAQSKVAELREAVERYMRLRLASEILRREIERYRERNQGPLLGRASALFGDLTLGSFAALQTSFDDKDEPILVGMRPSGAAVGVDGMSEGTRDQLYLSLRLATLERFVAHNEPLPFVVDDILIHFDDQRAEATLKVLAALSQKTQILFFTHHRRLLELAEAALEPAALQVHTLESIRKST